MKGKFFALFFLLSAAGLHSQAPEDTLGTIVQDEEISSRGSNEKPNLFDRQTIDSDQMYNRSYNQGNSGSYYYQNQSGNNGSNYYYNAPSQPNNSYYYQQGDDEGGY